MKVLLVTGQLAEHVVYDSALQQSGVDFCVRVLPISVAALLTPDFISRELKGEDLSDYDLVLVPGLVRGDVSIVEKAIGLPVFKGTRYASDIPVLFEALGHLKLSKTVAADSILSEELQGRTRAILEDAEHPEAALLKKPSNMIIGMQKGKSLFVGVDFPMRVVAEILDAPNLTEDEILRRARYYIESGAKVIDVGMRAEGPRPDDVKRIVSLLKGRVEVPISLDTLNPEDIDAGLESGVDMILSLNSSNIGALESLDNASSVAAVVIPERTERKGMASVNDLARVRVGSLEENIAKAKQVGFKKIIADPVMDPLVFPGMVTSVVTSKMFQEQWKDIPLMIGVGNVTELLDADSVGANATLAGIAQEIGASLLLTTEGSTKAKGTVNELARASQMMYLARKRKTPPKDVGVDLLILKEKRNRELPYYQDDKKLCREIEIPEGEPRPEPTEDPAGFFKVGVDRDNAEIVVTHFKVGTKSPDVILKGREPLAIRDTARRMGLISTIEHAYYLGIEIEKAYIASQINRGYYQDEDLFQKQQVR